MYEVNDPFWNEFEKSGRIEDYLKYKDIKDIEFSSRESEPIGNP